MKTFHDKSGLSKTSSPWLIHGMFLLCQYDGWFEVCKDIFEDHDRMGPSTSNRRISTEAMRSLVPRYWVTLSDVYLDALTTKDISDILGKDTAIADFVSTVLERSLTPEESAARAQEDAGLVRTAVQLYMAIYLPGEISDYVFATTQMKSKALQCAVSPETLDKMARMAISYADSPDTPDKLTVESLSLLMTTMMRRVGVMTGA